MSVAQNVLNDHWKVIFLRNRTAGTAPSLNIDPSFLQAILNDQRSNQAQSPYVNISMPDAAALLRNANMNKGKLDIEVAFEYRPIAGISDSFENYCAVGGASVRKVGTFRINRHTQKMSEAIGGEASLCSPETVSEQYERALMNLVKRSVETLIRQVEYEVFAKDGANFRHIGNLPNLTGVTRPAGEALPLFSLPNAGFQPAVNLLGMHNLRLDRRKGQQPNDTYAVASIKTSTFSDAFNFQGGYRPDGYNFVRGDNPIRALVISDIISEPLGQGGTGLDGALLIVPSGYLQFVSVNLNTPELRNVVNTGDQIRGTIVDPYLGLTWDFAENFDKCDRIIQRTLFLELFWGIISMPKCNEDEPALQGVNGIFLYNVSCSDETICDAQNANDLVVTAPPQAIENCAPDESEACGGDCGIGIRRVSINATDLVLTADYVLSQGASNWTSLVWAINATPAALYDDEVTPTIDISTLVDGDEITVTMIDDAGCEAVSAAFTYNA